MLYADNENFTMLFSKERVSGAADPDDDSSSEYKIDSALQAAKRALNMMSQTLYFPHRSDGHTKSIIRAEMISDSLSLVKYLQELGKEEETTQDHCYDLQRSILMSPNNLLAREAFGLV